MRYLNFILKTISLAVIGIALWQYQVRAVARAEIIAQNDAKVAEREAYNREIELENARRLAGAEGGAETSRRYKDGTFEGAGQGYGGPVVVSVTIEQDLITGIRVTAHDGEDPAYYALAEAVVDAALDAQSADVDTVSGATMSSTGIRDGIRAALREAEHDA